MPTYVYKFVETGETIEVQQAFTDEALTEAAHPQSGQVMAVKKVFQPVGVTFRGSGFFRTDNRGGASAGSSSRGTSDGGDAAPSGDGAKKSSKPDASTKSTSNDAKPSGSTGSASTAD